jgi:hypothetical protein
MSIAPIDVLRVAVACRGRVVLCGITLYAANEQADN